MALLLMFAWLFATGHLWVEHAGELPGNHGGGIVAIEHDHGDGHDHHHHDEDRGEEPVLPEAHHHHELGIAARDAGAVVVKAPLVAVLFVTFFLPEAIGSKDAPAPAITGSPPDERRSGYLFVVQTAHPVRGPSWVA
jgi:hypothetical protein